MGVAGTHCVNEQWQNTVPDHVHCMLTGVKSVMDTAVSARTPCIKNHSGFDFAGKVAECSWDGAPAAMAILPQHVPGVQATFASSMRGRRFTI